MRVRQEKAVLSGRPRFSPLRRLQKSYACGIMDTLNQETRLLGHVGWDGSAATSERVMLRASVLNRKQVARNQYVRIQDEAGVRSGFLARIVSGPFFHRAGAPTVGGTTASSSMECFLLADLAIPGELVQGRSRDPNSRPAPGSQATSPPS